MIITDHLPDSVDDRPDTMPEDTKLMISQALSEGYTLAIYDTYITVDDVSKKLIIQGKNTDAAICQAFAEVLDEVETLKQDEHPIDPETGAAVEVYGYEATHNQAIDQVTALLKRRIER